MKRLKSWFTAKRAAASTALRQWAATTAAKAVLRYTGGQPSDVLVAYAKATGFDPNTVLEWAQHKVRHEHSDALAIKARAVYPPLERFDHPGVSSAWLDRRVELLSTRVDSLEAQLRNSFNTKVSHKTGLPVR